MAQATVGDTAMRSELAVPTLNYSLDVNALNFCCFSLLPLDLDSSSAPSPSSSSIEPDGTALVAVPNLVESSLVSIIILSKISPNSYYDYLRQMYGNYHYAGGYMQPSGN